MLPALGKIKDKVILKGRKSAFYFSNNILNRRGKYNLNDILLKLDVTAKSYKYALACINILFSYIKSDRRVCRERPPCCSESGFVYLYNLYAKRVFAAESNL